MPLGDTECIVLAGGLGTRLNPALPGRQKVLAEIGGRPFLSYLLEYLADRGWRRVVLALGHHAEQAEDLLAGNGFGLELVASVEREPLGTAGAIRLAAVQTAGRQVLVMNGDSFAPVDLAALADFHAGHEAVASLALIEMASIRDYGAVEVDAGGVIRRFREKSGEGPGLVNAGIYLMSRALLQQLPEKGSLERDVLPGLCGNGLYGLAQAVPFLDIGTPERYGQAAAFLASLKGRA